MESNFFEKSWQEFFRRPKLHKIREVKAKYDLEGLFFVHHGVGSERRCFHAIEKIVIDNRGRAETCAEQKGCTYFEKYGTEGL